MYSDTKLKPFGLIRLFSYLLLLGFIMLFAPRLSAQDKEDQKIKWNSIDQFEVYGSLNDFKNGEIQRFPDALKDKLRERLWGLSENTAGLYLKFKTNSPQIKVSYRPSGALNFPHMPATGVSGVDLYLKQGDRFDWIRGHYSFGELVSYSFSGMELPEGNYEFWLYLPLFQSIEDFKIGIPESYTISSIDKTSEYHPVIVYGTSIAQGACASRAGMAWSNILGRQIPYTVVNLGFSGNGRLESEVIDYIADFKASVFVLDCMANFTSGQGLNPMAARERLINSIKTLKQRHPQTPILLVEHAGYSDGVIQKHRFTIYTELNKVTQEVYLKLKDSYDGLFLLTKEDIGLTADSFVDGTHPNDYGMLQYAKAYEKALTAILKLRSIPLPINDE